MYQFRRMDFYITVTIDCMIDCMEDNMPAKKKLMGEYKECEYCGRPLPPDYKETLCPVCMEIQLFREVKEYIRSNDVNEYNVAEHFHIPLRQVKDWIRDGRIEYRTDNTPTNIVSLYCQQCHAPIAFGTLCSKCLKQKNSKGFSGQITETDNRMRFLDSDKGGQ